MLTAKGRLFLVVTAVILVYIIGVFGLAKNHRNLKSNVKSYIESQHGRR